MRTRFQVQHIIDELKRKEAPGKAIKAFRDQAVASLEEHRQILIKAAVKLMMIEGQDEEDAAAFLEDAVVIYDTAAGRDEQYDILNISLHDKMRYVVTHVPIKVRKRNVLGLDQIEMVPFDGRSRCCVHVVERTADKDGVEKEEMLSTDVITIGEAFHAMMFYYAQIVKKNEEESLARQDTAMPVEAAKMATVAEELPVAVAK